MADGTPFTAVYNRFLEKITDDMYMELTPEDTARDLQNLLVDAIPGFEFPRKCLDDYLIETKIIDESEVQQGDFVLAVLWDEVSEDGTILSPDGEGTLSPDQTLETPNVLVERSRFNVVLTSEEINILALLMKQAWVQRQVTSIENTRMKYSGSDFKFTSQANHLSKLLSLLEESRRDSFHMQRLYKRRIKDDDGVYQSNWSILREKGVYK